MPVNSIEDIWAVVCEECKKTVSEFDLGYPIVARVKRTIKTAEALGIHGEEAARE